ncbi:hypothetical protein [Niveispirillum irakense]|uniref:hypothetical protein n=1 Tax=Niveispirillum irakense TaxID=34011 RepID=UPI000428B094|nr:hypothetical protein [Niveispirillum irakense]
MPALPPAPGTAPLPDWPAVQVDGLAAGRLVLKVAAGRPVILLSAPGIAGLAGAGWWAELATAWRGEAGQAPFLPLLDVVDMPGQALAALRAGVSAIAFTPGPTTPDGVLERLAGLAAAHGACLYPVPPVSIQPCWTRNRDAVLQQWLMQQLGFQGL